MVVIATAEPVERVIMETIGKYEILDKIGSGGFAIVYKGYDPFIKRPVALKVCFSRDESTRRRFYREAEIAGRLVHRNITTVHDFGLHEDMPYLVEEYLSGEDLAHMVQRQEPHFLDEKLAYLVQIVDGLGFAHSQGVIHRDIKPSNVRVLDNGRVKIMDFGTAKLAGAESNLTQTGMTMGTIAYLAPERLRGRTADAASDLYSFGVLAYELVAFSRPFHDTNIPALIDRILTTEVPPLAERAPDCPPTLTAIIERCLAKDPADRWQDAAELLAVLNPFQQSRMPDAKADPLDASHVTDAGVVAGLLDRARRHLERNRGERARLLVEEALEIDPRSVAAQQLMATCDEPHPRAGTAAPRARGDAGSHQEATSSARSDDTAGMPSTPASAASSSPAPATSTPDPRRSEAVESIEHLIDGGRWTAAAKALHFAEHLFGEFNHEVPALRGKIVEAVKQATQEVRVDGQAQAQRITNVLIRWVNLGDVSRDLAEHFAERAEDLAPGHTEARALLQRLDTRTAVTNEDHRGAQRAEAIASVERLLAQGQAALADEALRFAFGLFGAFPEATPLRRQIDAALGHTNADD